VVTSSLPPELSNAGDFSRSSIEARIRAGYEDAMNQASVTSTPRDSGSGRRRPTSNRSPRRADRPGGHRASTQDRPCTVGRPRAVRQALLPTRDSLLAAELCPLVAARCAARDRAGGLSKGAHLAGQKVPPLQGRVPAHIIGTARHAGHHGAAVARIGSVTDRYLTATAT
jgi:hypothetical protein